MFNMIIPIVIAILLAPMVGAIITISSYLVGTILALIISGIICAVWRSISFYEAFVPLAFILGWLTTFLVWMSIIIWCVVEFLWI